MDGPMRFASRPNLGGDEYADGERNLYERRMDLLSFRAHPWGRVLKLLGEA
jgi:hypothetical protein